VKYYYFIHYSYGNTEGMLEEVRDTPITKFEDLRSICQSLRERGKEQAIIRNYQLLRVEN